MMRALAIAVAVAALLWGGWWVVGARGLERGIEAAGDAARGRGWHLAYADLTVRGFPNRFDTTVTAPELAPPDGAWAWSAPFVQVLALSYRPNHVIVAAPPEQALALPGATLRATSDDLRASIVVAPGLDLALDRANLAGAGLAVTDGRDALTVAALRAAVRRAEGGGASGGAAYDVALGAEGIGVPEGLRAALSPDLPAEAGAVTLDATVTLDRPLDRRLAGPPAVVGVALRDAALRWGDLRVAASGRLAADPAGLAEGALELRLADPDAAVAALGELVPPGQAAFAARFLAGLPEAEGGGVAVPLGVRGGVVSFGPVPLVALPPLSRPGS